MLDGEQTFWQRKRLVIRIALSFVILFIVFAVYYQPSSPDGIYYDPDLACGHGCWIFKDGKIFVRCDDEVPQASGIYSKSGKNWISANNPTNFVIFKPSLFGLNVVGSQYQHGQTFWPRNCFSWVVDCKEWIQKHF
jgi:hypothetical protein